MTDDEVADVLRKVAIQLAKPILNGEVVAPPSEVQGNDDLFTILWEHGYLPACAELRAQGATDHQIDIALTEFKRIGGIIELKDLVEFPAELRNDLRTDYDAELPHEPPLPLLRLDERIIKEITDFKVEMFTNEGQHSGRPHVKVHLKNGAVSISLDDPPQNLTPRGGLVGEATAIKVIAKSRKRLLKLWNDTRPDTQKLADKDLKSAKAKSSSNPKAAAKPKPKAKAKRSSPKR